MDCIVHGVTKSQTQLSNFHFTKSFPHFVVIHTVKVFSVVDETEVNIFLECPFFLYDTANVGDLISGYFVFGVRAKKKYIYIYIYN